MAAMVLLLTPEGVLAVAVVLVQPVLPEPVLLVVTEAMELHLPYLVHQLLMPVVAVVVVMM
jgi:hypothetical protein